MKIIGERLIVKYVTTDGRRLKDGKGLINHVFICENEVKLLITYFEHEPDKDIKIQFYREMVKQSESVQDYHKRLITKALGQIDRLL